MNSKQMPHNKSRGNVQPTYRLDMSGVGVSKIQIQDEGAVFVYNQVYGTFMSAQYTLTARWCLAQTCNKHLVIGQDQSWTYTRWGFIFVFPSTIC